MRPNSQSSRILVCALLVSASSASCRAQTVEQPASASPTSFRDPQRVAIVGYNDDAMEPFVSRDGHYLFFNNLNEPRVNTNLYWAERIDDLHFQYQGEIRGVNTPALEGVASMDRDGNFYFVSNRSYRQTASTLYHGHFADGGVTDIALVPGVSLAKRGIVNFDAEISADGNSLYFVESQFSWRGKPKSARILIARRTGDRFVRDPASEFIMNLVNIGGLNYAPATSASECEIFFTRAGPRGLVLYTAKRHDTMKPFESPVPIAASSGFVEAPSLSSTGKSLYYHKKEDGRFVIYRVTRP